MKRDNHKVWRWQAGDTLDAWVASKAGKALGGQSPLIADVLRFLPWQALMGLDAEFRELYEDPSLCLRESCRALRMTMLPKMPNAQTLRKYRSISAIDAMAKFYMAVLADGTPRERTWPFCSGCLLPAHGLRVRSGRGCRADR